MNGQMNENEIKDEINESRLCKSYSTRSADLMLRVGINERCEYGLERGRSVTFNTENNEGIALATTVAAPLAMLALKITSPPPFKSMPVHILTY